MSYLGFCPPGVVFPYAGSTAPEGWLLCNGQAYATASYPALSAVLGSTYNTQTDPTTGSAWASPGAGNFRVPDYRGMFLRGVGTASGLDATTLGAYQVQKTKPNGLSNAAGSTTVSGNKNQFDNTSASNGGHNHQIPRFTGAGSGGWYSDIVLSNGTMDANGATQTVAAHTHGITYSSTFSATGSTSAQTISGDNETRPINRGVNYIIKI